MQLKFLIITALLYTILRSTPSVGVNLKFHSRVKEDHCLEFRELANHGDLEESLQCVTDQSGGGVWVFPSGSATVPFDDTDEWLYQMREDEIVTLYHNPSGNTSTAVEGVYSCVQAPNTAGDIYSLHVGLYLSCGAPIVESVDYNPLTDNSAAVHRFTLSCITSGAPATTVLWTRDCLPLPRDSNHVQSKTLLDSSLARYSSSVMVNSNERGDYRCIVINRGGSISASHVVNGTTFICSWLAQNGDYIFNHGIVSWTELSTNMMNAPQCWNSANTNEVNSTWYYPNGTEVAGKGDADIYQQHGENSAYLLFKETGAVSPNALFSCVAGNETLYVAILNSDPKTLGTPLIESIEFEFLNNVTKEFQITCTTSDGPLTNVYWLQNCSPIQPDVNISISLNMIDSQSMRYNSSLRTVGEPYGIWISHDGSLVPNNSIVELQSVGEQDWALQCWTNRQDCCSGGYTGGAGAIGFWHSPAETILSIGGTHIASRNAFTQYRYHQYINMNHVGDGGEEGLYSCDIEMSDGTVHWMYVGVYSEEDSSGIPVVIGGIEIEVLSEASLAENVAFSLTCVSSGGPVEGATWLLEGVDVAVGENSSDFVMVKNILDTRTATYSNQLLVTAAGPHIMGAYQCSVGNRKGTSPTIASLNVNVLSPPTVLSAISLSPTSVDLVWTNELTSQTDYTVIDLYEVSFDPTEDSLCSSVGLNTTASVLVSGDLTHYTLDGLEENTSYVISVAALNGLGHSGTNGSVTVATLADAPSVPPASVSGTAVSAVAMRIQWDPIACWARNSRIAQYIVQYTDCSDSDSFISCNYGYPLDDFTHSQAVLDGITTGVTIISLIPFTNYSIQVVSLNAEGLRGPASDVIIVETLQSKPGHVDSLTATPQLVSVLINWSVPTAPNGRITLYEVRYSGPEVDGTLNTTLLFFELGDLHPGANYSFDVRAFTVIGAGEWSNVETTPSSLITVDGVKATLIGTDSVLIDWHPVTETGVEVQHYTVYYLHYPHNSSGKMEGKPIARKEVMENCLLHLRKTMSPVRIRMSVEIPHNKTTAIIHQLLQGQVYVFQVAVIMEIAGEIVESRKSQMNEDSVVSVVEVHSPATVCIRVTTLAAALAAAAVTLIFIVLTGVQCCSCSILFCQKKKR